MTGEYNGISVARDIEGVPAFVIPAARQIVSRDADDETELKNWAYVTPFGATALAAYPAHRWCRKVAAERPSGIGFARPFRAENMVADPVTNLLLPIFTSS